MAGTVELTPRPIYLEDLATTAAPGTTEADVEVLGGGTMTMTKVPITLLTQLVAAASDAAAATGGVPLGGIYFLTTTSTLQARRT